MQMEKESRHISRVMRTSIGTVTTVSIKFVKKKKKENKKVVRNRVQYTKHAARNTDRKTGREESIHT